MDVVVLVDAETLMGKVVEDVCVNFVTKLAWEAEKGRKSRH